MNLKTPQSIDAEHEELHAELAKAVKAGGATGKAAKGVDCVLHPHFLKEEEYALPPLGLLPALASGTALPDVWPKPAERKPGSAGTFGFAQTGPATASSRHAMIAA